MKDSIHKFWEVENVGVDEHPVYENFKQTISFDGETYVTALPSKPFHKPLPDNYALSKHRLSILKTKLDKNEELKQEYNQVFDNYLKDGIIEKVADNDYGLVEKTHYLSHRAVVWCDKETTKVRAVFDVSVKNGNEPSLNDCLYAGPCLLRQLYDIFVRFHLHNIILMSDIKQAFLNVVIRDEDRDNLRFLCDDPFSTEPKIIILRFLRVVFGIISSPFLLNETMKYHLERYLNEAKNFVEKFLNDLYVDDSTFGFFNVKEAYDFYLNAKRIMKECGFELRKWASNSVELMNKINRDENINCSDSSNESNHTRKVLGINWDLSADTVIFYFDELVNEAFSLPMTKRSILKISAKIFDPLGLTSPITIQFKMLFQIICTNKFNWDDPLPNDLLKEWINLLEKLRTLDKLVVPRAILKDIKENEVLRCEMHGFCDSSLKAYSAMVYLKVLTKEKCFVCLLSAKSKVAPYKTLTIPQLELLRCHLLSKLVDSVKRAIRMLMKFDEVYLWTDSEICLWR